MDISKELQEILEQLQAIQPKRETQTQAQAPSSQIEAQTQAQSFEQSNQTTSETTYDLNEIKKQVEDWIAIGRQIFISKYAMYPHIIKLLPAIEQRARLILKADLEKGVDPKSSFDLYMEESKEQIQKELLEVAQSFNTMNPQSVISAQNVVQPRQREPIYSLEDFYNDYKRMLEDITDENTTILFQDGKRLENGKLTRFGEGRKKLGQRPVITVE